MTSVLLDERQTYERLDPAGMRDLVAALPRQCRSAWDLARGWPLPDSFSRPERVVIFGVGGSAIGAELVASIASKSSSVPVQVVRGYVPPTLDARTLVIAVSHSGDTEETLSAFAATASITSMRLAITTGGRLAREANREGYALWRYDFKGMPRAAVGWGILPLLALLHRIDVISLDSACVDAALGQLERAGEGWAPASCIGENAAKRLAIRLEGRVPLVVGADVLEGVARRWANQFNENAKQWAFHTELPEADHNLIAGLGAPLAMVESAHVVFLASNLLHPRNRHRIRLTAEVLDRVGIGHDEVFIAGADPLDVMLRATQFGDWTSLYLAILNGVDPTPIVPLEELKRAMRALPACD